MPNMSLTTEQMQARSLALNEYESAKKKGVVAWLLWLFLGALGAHRFYLGHTGYAIGMLLTAGGLGFWALIDAFFINKNLRLQNRQSWTNAAMRYQIPLDPMPEGTR
ncbi:hypothetical protein BSP99_08580 [Corynebacterium glutamicum]|nr:hypothetical protein BBD29_08325 [Corynebacterium glutamicum]APT07506.1 hypothetical protein BSP99_08580 [Corynebacterium glutamicum]